MQKPDPLLQVILHDTAQIGDRVGMCAGFERGRWRAEALASHVMEWLPEFALNHSELSQIGHHNAVRMVKRAARVVYKTEKYGKRGEFGEILLHIALRQVFGTLPAVSKIYYKSAVNKTVEGFDAVHVVDKSGELELWIGEAKFYKKLQQAVNAVCDELLVHLETDYLRDEFILIRNKIDPEWPHAERLRQLLNENTSLDDVFARAAIAVLLTYDSAAVQAAKESNDTYRGTVIKEFEAGFQKLRTRLGTEYYEKFNTELKITVHIILVPLNSKDELPKALHHNLKELQG